MITRTSPIRGMMLGLLLAGIAPVGMAQLQPWASNTHPSDVARTHVEEIREGRHAYTIVQGGTMDGENCRSPLGCGMAREGAIEQVWQSNRSVRMENVGASDVINPWLSNGRNNFRNLDEIVVAAADKKMSDREKAMTLWFQQTQHRFHRMGGEDLGDPVKVYNVYGHNPCGSDAILMGGMWRRVGIKGAPARLVGHAIAQAYFEGGWHLLDGDLDQFFLLRDNVTIASDRDLARDHDLVKRSHTLGLLLNDSRGMDEREAAMFVCEDEIKGERRCKEDTTMNMTLRPGEAITWRWGHLQPAKYMWKDVQPDYPDTVCNGLWEYRPNLSDGLWKRGAVKVENIVSGPAGLRAQEGTTGTIIWIVRSPYVFVGGQLEIQGSGARFAVSADGKEWTDIQPGSFDSLFPNSGPARYEYRLRCTLSGEATLSSIKITNDLQMALLAMPEMRVGPNVFTYTDASPADRQVRITHAWVERSASRPPEAPAAAVYPPDGGSADGSDIAFRWQPPGAGEAVADYHFELSDRPDLKYPLSTNFYKLISRTADRGKAQYTLPYPGLLSPERTYYWHVRAKNAEGVWGPWSRTWSFSVRAPAEPVEVRLDYDPAKGIGTLRWKPNPAGNRPAAYRVYASDEKGFSISDVPYAVDIGISKELPKQFPANFVGEISASAGESELAVVGSGVTLPNANRVYYRVVAVDPQGKRSGPSDYAAAPRPIIYSVPVMVAKVGEAYRYQPSASRSLGDLRFHQVKGAEVASFWDIERPAFALEQGPAWLKIDPQTGELSGTPDASGSAEVAITATIDRDVRQLSESALGWGIETVTGTSRERVGQFTQRYRIEVQQ